MTGEHDKERRECLAKVAPHGWLPIKRSPKTGYTTMHCSCGAHQLRLPSTPSNRWTFRRKADRMISLCSILGQR